MVSESDTPSAHRFLDHTPLLVVGGLTRRFGGLADLGASRSPFRGSAFVA
jgi:hypothetical protein